MVETIHSLDELHIFTSVSFDKEDSVDLSGAILPTEDPNGCLIDSKKEKYATLTYQSVSFQGGYGYLIKSIRETAEAQYPIMVKRPIHEYSQLGQEALVQWFVRKALKPYGLQTAISKVYDIFRRSGKVCFSMEYIRGVFPYEYILKSKQPDHVFFQIMAQLALLCGILQRDIRFDHRDLKADNVFIRAKPVRYSVSFGTKLYTLECPFQLVIMDFGFACLGNIKGITQVNLAKDILPQLDPCPKIGRDIFHCVASFWTSPSLRDKMSMETQTEVDSWFISGKRDYSKLVKKFTNTEWIYILTAEPDFKHGALDIDTLLARIALLHPSCLRVSEILEAN
jgi:serine/threonine protein kinase